MNTEKAITNTTAKGTCKIIKEARPNTTVKGTGNEYTTGKLARPDTTTKCTGNANTNEKLAISEIKGTTNHKTK